MAVFDSLSYHFIFPEVTSPVVLS
ncbi:uncharacterized protein METZ01_LOCUS157304 [marine metagenome]|uniref:Uncharacterized protein n=1 Tax=marine metagenome TaxID=408172 RepID=A0A382ASD1_9ZZZZ